MDINVRVTVDLSPSTIELLKGFLSKAVAKQECEPQKKDEKPAEQVEPIAPTSAPVEDLPVVEEPKEITEDDLAAATRKKVEELKAKGMKAADLKKLFNEKVFGPYGIEKSVDCPKERRAEFLQTLNTL